MVTSGRLDDSRQSSGSFAPKQPRRNCIIIEHSIIFCSISLQRQRTQIPKIDCNISLFIDHVQSELHRGHLKLVQRLLSNQTVTIEIDMKLEIIFIRQIYAFISRFAIGCAYHIIWNHKISIDKPSHKYLIWTVSTFRLTSDCRRIKYAKIDSFDKPSEYY